MTDPKKKNPEEVPLVAPIPEIQQEPEHPFEEPKQPTIVPQEKPGVPTPPEPETPSVMPEFQ